MNRKTGAGIMLVLLIVIGVLSWKLYEATKPADCAELPRDAHKPKISTFALSVIDTVNSALLKEKRVINVYLPDDYSPDSANTYPVIYLLDGGTDEDFIRVAGVVHYNTQPWIARFPKSIVVGITNTNRKRDFTFAVNDLKFLDRLGFKPGQFPSYGGSGPFISFIENELQPFIEKKYRANKTRTLIGESLGGLLASEILLKHRKLFGTYIIIAPSLWWGKESLLEEAPALLATEIIDTTKVFIAAANKEEDKVMYEDAVALHEVLKKKEKNIQVYYDYLPDEGHATISQQALIDAFKQLYPLK